jgi:uncharacterized protein YcfJ
VKVSTKTIVACSVVATSLASAQSHTSVVEVPVTAVEPVVRIITRKIPQESCWDERVKVVREGGNHSATPAVLGAIIGGVVGGSVGHNSRYQPIIAGAGALLGSSIGNDISHQRNTQSYYVTEQRCEVDYELRDEKQIVGYRVSYQYGGSIYQTQTPDHPGATIQLQVNVNPVGL